MSSSHKRDCQCESCKHARWQLAQAEISNLSAVTKKFIKNRLTAKIGKKRRNP